MKTIKIVKTTERALSDLEIYDIISKTSIGTIELIDQLAFLYRRTKQMSSREIPPTIPEALINILSYYNNIIFIEGEDGFNVTFASPVKYIKENNLQGIPNKSNSVKVSGIFIDPKLPIIDMPPSDKCLMSPVYANIHSISATFGDLVKPDLIDLNFKVNYDNGETYYLITNDINVYSRLYSILYYLENRNIFSIKDNQMTELEIVTDMVLKLSKHLMGFAKILGIKTEYNDIVYQSAFSAKYNELYIEYLKGNQIELPEKEEVKPIPNIYRDFLLRYLYVKEYGIDAYKDTGIIDIERRYGYDLKGNIYGDIYFEKIIPKNILDRLNELIARYESPSAVYPWQEILNRLRFASKPAVINALISELAAYIKETGDYMLDDKGNKIICAHLYVIYTNPGVGVNEYEALMAPFKLKSQNIYICRICGEFIDTIDIFMMDFEDIYTVYVENANKQTVRLITGKVATVLRRVVDLPKKLFDSIVNKITYFIYESTRGISEELSRNKILSDIEREEHMKIYVTIYSYASVFKISNEASKSGTLIQTSYTGKKLATVLDSIVGDILHECGSLIKKYKSFTEKTIKLILLNAYRDLNPTGIDYGETIRGNPVTGIIQGLYDHFGKIPLGEKPSAGFLDSEAYVATRALRNVLSYDKVASLNNYVMLGDSINSIYLNTIDQEMFGFDADLSSMYYGENPRFISAHLEGKNYFYRKPYSDMDIEYIRGEHGKHEYGGIKPFKDPNSSICKKCQFDYMNKPTKGFEIMAKWELATSIDFFYKKYSKICLRPTVEQLKQGNVYHDFQKDICVNCGYVKDTRDVEFYESYKISEIAVDVSGVLYYVPPELNDFIKEWKYNPYLHIKVLDHSGFDMISRDMATIWLNNLGLEQKLDKVEMFTNTDEIEESREDILFSYIVLAHYIISCLDSHVNIKDTDIKTFAAEHPNIKVDIVHDENIDIYSLSLLIGDTDKYLHNYLMRLLLKVEPSLSKFILEQIYARSMKIAKYTLADYYKAMTDIQTKDIQYDDYADEDFNPFADVDYNGENDEGAFD